VVARRHTLFLVSDRAQPSLEGRWWNLFRVRGDAAEGSALLEPVYPLAAEFGRPQWQFRMSTFAFSSAGQLVCSFVQNGIHRMAGVDLGTLQTSSIATEYEDISSLRRPPDGSISAAARRPARRPWSNWTCSGRAETLKPRRRRMSRLVADTFRAGAGDIRYG
jgi:hypothetical protein